MAFPAAEAFDCPFSDGSGNIALPGAAAAGRLLIATCLNFSGAGGITPSDGLTLLVDTAVGGSGFFLTTYTKVLDGTEGGSIQFGGAGSSYCAVAIFSGHGAPTDPPDAAGASGSGASADPPNLTPTGGAKDYLWYEIGASAASGITAVSSGFSNGAASFDETVRTGYRTSNAASENPGTMAHASSGTWAAQTIAIHPVGGGGGGLAIPVAMHSYRQRRT